MERITFGLGQVAAFLAFLTMAVAGWSYLDPGKSKIQIVITVVGVQTFLLFGALVQRGAARQAGEWRHLRPGFLLWACLGMLTPVSLLLALVFFGTDWSRYPHGDQSLPVLAMLVGFGSGAIWSAAQIFARVLRWNEHVLQQRTALLQVRELAWEDIVDTRSSELASTLTLIGRDGTSISVSVDANGLDDFLLDARRLAVSLPRHDDQDDD